MDAVEKQQEELRRLTWHSHRGMLELDILLLPFTEQQFLSLNDEDKKAYRRLINCEDQDLFNWFMEKAEAPDADIQRMVRAVLSHARQG